MWWIDRWRQSTAYIDMSAEEQGLYRNLLDDVWLRDDHTIPDDPRILARASGDPEAWARCGAKVLRWMTRTDTGWTNDIAIEIKKTSTSIHDKRAESGSKGGSKTQAKRKANAKAKTKHQDQDQDLYQEQKNEPSVASAPAPWSHEAIDDWNERFGNGSAPTGRIGKALKPVVTANGWELVRPAWRRYLAEKESKFANPQDFAAHWIDWAGDKPRAGHVIPL